MPLHGPAWPEPAPYPKELGSRTQQESTAHVSPTEGKFKVSSIERLCENMR